MVGMIKHVVCSLSGSGSVWVQVCCVLFQVLGLSGCRCSVFSFRIWVYLSAGVVCSLWGSGSVWVQVWCVLFQDLGPSGYMCGVFFFRIWASWYTRGMFPFGICICLDTGVACSLSVSGSVWVQVWHVLFRDLGLSWYRIVWCVFFQDLGLSGYRCGVLQTRNRHLLQFATAVGIFHLTPPLMQRRLGHILSDTGE